MTLLVVLDVDSTLIQQEVIELLADHAGVTAAVREITERAMAGELDFESSLRERVALLKGVSATNFQAVTDRIEVTPGVVELIDSVHRASGKVGAVSGGFIQILEPLAKRLELDFWRANELEVALGALTGKVVGRVIDRSAKAEALLEWANLSGISRQDTVAVGDGANDIDMLQAAGTAVAFRPKPILRQYADLIIEENSMLPLIQKLGLSAG